MRRLVLLATVALLAMTVFAPAAIAADEGYFDITVKHRINGEPLGLDRDLPVDVYVNGNKAFTFQKADTVRTQLPAGDYFIEVKLAGTDTTVLSLDAGEIPADVSVSITAKRFGQGIGLKVGVK